MKLYKWILIIFTIILLNISAIANEEIINIYPEKISNSTLIWKGFNYKWEREILLFKTPHRMGSIGSQIMEEQFNSRDVSGEVDFLFTPGVNGDYAYPKTNFTAVYPQTNYTTTLFSRSSVKFNFTDEANHNSSSPSSNSKIIKYFKFYDGQPLNTQNLIINGFKINMKCIDTDCNSNGVWPSKLLVDITKDENNSTQSKLIFELNRGWTPAKGGGKAFNYKMEYNVEIDILSIVDSSNYLNIYEDIIELKSNNHHGPLNIERQINNCSDIHSIDNFSPLTGISGFGFELYKYKNYDELGRYIGNIRFELGKTYLENNKLKYNAVFNINSAYATTYYTDLGYFMKTKTFLLSNKFNSKDLQATGTVCKTDFSTLFFCSWKGMKDIQSDFVKFNSTLD